MVVLFVLFAALCAVTVMIARFRVFESSSIGFNISIIVFSLSMFAIWYGLRFFSPQNSIWGHWRMVMISLAGFLSMLFSATLALKNLTGIQSVSYAVISTVIGIIHLIYLIASVPVS